MKHTDNLDPIVTLAIEDQMPLEAPDWLHPKILQAWMPKGALCSHAWRLEESFRRLFDGGQEPLRNFCTCMREVVDKLIGEVGFGLWTPSYTPAHVRLNAESLSEKLLSGINLL